MNEDATPGSPAPVRTSVTPEALADMLRGRGFRAEMLADESGVPVLRSASSGLLFHMRPGNPAGEGAYLDFSYVCLVQSDTPPDAALATTWNAGKRFGRLHVHDRLAVLEMDVLVAGGVTDAYLLTTLEIWDRLMQELLAMLRAGLRPAPEGAGPAVS